MPEEHKPEDMDLLDAAAAEVDAEEGIAAENDVESIEDKARELVAEENRDVREEVFGPSDEQLMRELRAWGLIPKEGK